MTSELRTGFTTEYNKDSCFRRLANKISTLDEHTAQKIGLFELHKSRAYPANFLVNGSDETFKPVWTTHQEPDCLSLYDLAGWKFDVSSAFDAKPTRYGFNNHLKGSRGLSLLFDPLIDTFIELNRGSIGKSFVIVLTDFYPFYLCNSDMLTGRDWGSEQTRNYLSGTETGATLGPIVAALSEVFHRQGTENGTEKFEGLGVYLWNFFPFFRGGAGHSGGIGLPETAKWVEKALEWLSIFLECVKAHTVVLACSDWVFPHHKDINKCHENLVGKYRDEFSWNWSKGDMNLIPNNLYQTLPCTNIFRIYHPALWNRREIMQKIFKNVVRQWASETNRPL